MFEIAGRSIGHGFPTYLIAEIGNNHNGDPAKAERLIRAAAAAGADAVKFQTFRAEDIHNPTVPANAYPAFDASANFERWIDYVRTTELDYGHYDRLMAVAQESGVHFLSTPASPDALSLLIEKGVPAVKVASMDLTNIPFLERCAGARVPVILSTGMATLAEIDEAVEVLADAPLAILHCVSNYPTDDGDARLLNIPMLADRYRAAVAGFSSHAPGIDLEPSAVALGARIVEKHFTLDDGDADLAEHHVSATPESFAEMARRIRRIDLALGGSERILCAMERENRDAARRSVVAKRMIAKDAVIASEDLDLIRPGTGISPKDLSAVIGRAAKRDIPAFTALRWDDVQ